MTAESCSRRQKLAIAAGIAVPVLIAGLFIGPELLYRIGLQLVPELPQPPAEHRLDPAIARRVFLEHDWQRSAYDVEPLSVPGLFSLLVCETLSPIRDPASCRRPGLMAAAQVAQDQLAGHDVSPLRSAFEHASLVTWLSRNWRASDLAERLAASPPLAPEPAPGDGNDDTPHL